MTYGETPMADQTPPEWRGKVAHMRMTVGGTLLMGSDLPPDRWEKMQGITVTLGIDEPAEAERVFHSLAAGRHGDDADPGDLLGAPVRHGDRPLRGALDDQLRKADVTAHTFTPAKAGVQGDRQTGGPWIPVARE